MTPKSEINRRHNAKKREQGFVRGPSLSAEAAERLALLAFKNHLTKGEVLNRMLLEIPLSKEGRFQTFQQREGLSDSEMRAFGTPML